MTYNFCPILTKDGTVSLFNFQVNDIYHSKIGAYTEALEKFLRPSEIINFVKTNKEIKILDICFGLGYNSKVAITEIFNTNPECAVYVDAIEMDKNVLMLSTLFSDERFFDIDIKFFDAVSKKINMGNFIQNFTESYAELYPEFEKILPKEYILIPPTELNSKLHNIYYQTISSRNMNIPKESPSQGLLTIDIYNDDARKSIHYLNKQYDFIFLDAFTPSKLPTLWTVEFFKVLFDLLTPNGNLTTYTSSAAVRGGLTEAGFYIGNTLPVGKKSPGTFVCKNPDCIKYPLTEEQFGLLNTKAGIPYYDKDLAGTVTSILKDRENMQTNSGRISSSRFFRSKRIF